jgi:hypothetical protein
MQRREVEIESLQLLKDFPLGISISNIKTPKGETLPDILKANKLQTIEREVLSMLDLKNVLFI